jgi:DNA mismatch endonuclease (patch repair protein)
MADVFDSEKRSEIMSAIRSKNTKAELIVFSYLRKNKVHFLKHYSRAPGKPDIAVPRKKLACFIDGDFWHGRSVHDIARRRGENDYWSRKIAKNIERDAMQRSELKLNGWKVLSVWESDIMRKKTRDDILMKIKQFLS